MVGKKEKPHQTPLSRKFSPTLFPSRQSLSPAILPTLQQPRAVCRQSSVRRRLSFRLWVGVILSLSFLSLSLSPSSLYGCRRSSVDLVTDHCMVPFVAAARLPPPTAVARGIFIFKCLFGKLLGFSCKLLNAHWVLA